MKLSSLLGLVAIGVQGQQFKAQVSVEEGGVLKEGCSQANKWTLSKLGSTSEEDQEELKPFTAESPTDRYELTNNELKIMPNKKDRSMMGVIKCQKDDATLQKFRVTGKPVFANLANSLTNLDGDNSKRMDCAVTGYPQPTLSWKFQAIDKEEAEAQCEGGVCTPCFAEDCNASFCNDEPECVARYYSTNSTDLFKITSISQNLQVRYSLNKVGACPMTSSSLEGYDNCTIVSNEEAADALDLSYRSKSQLFFPNVTYSQRGKYICVALQEISSTESTERTKAFIWRVKDPIAALWPFLALVTEVMIVVAIILYYEKASASKAESNDEEGGEFLATNKKEES